MSLKSNRQPEMSFLFEVTEDLCRPGQCTSSLTQMAVGRMNIYFMEGWG